MPDFDGLRGAVVAGDGIVARYPGVVCVAKWSDAVDPAHVRRLLELCSEVAGDAPGRVLARRLATWLGGADGPSEGLCFGTVAVTGADGLAVFLSGGVSVQVPDQGTTISGADAVAWTDRLLKRPGTPMVLAVDGVPPPADLLAGVLDLQAGVVPGSAVVLAVADTAPAVKVARPVASAPPVAPAPPAPAPAPPVASPPPVAPPLPPPPVPAPAVVVAPEPTHVHEPGHVHEPVAPVPPPQPVPRTPSRASKIFGGDAPEEARPPLDSGGPVAADDGSDAAAVEVGLNGSEEPQATGHVCSRGHLNDPRSHFCVLCGIRMNQQTGVLTLGPRPPLGLLVFDDGATYTVDAEYLVGRMPDVDERVSSGSLRSIVIEDKSGSVSRVHAEIRLNGWDVVLVDSGSRNGTFVAPPGETSWTTLPPSESRRLEPGTRVRLGARTFTFESPSGVR